MFLKEPHALAIKDHNVELEAPSSHGPPRKRGSREWMDLPRVSHTLSTDVSLLTFPTP